jgi:hypothetical protein
MLWFLSKGHTAANLERSSRISAHTLYRWPDEFAAGKRGQQQEIRELFCKEIAIFRYEY